MTLSPRSQITQAMTLAALAAFLVSCQPPRYDSAHPDALRSGPFWEREEQRD